MVIGLGSKYETKRKRTGQKKEKENDPLPEYLKNTYSKQDPFFRYLFENKPDPGNWDGETGMFLLAVGALIKRSMKDRKFVCEVVAGCSRRGLDNLVPESLLTKAISLLVKPKSSEPENQLIVNSITSKGQITPSTVATESSAGSAFELEIELDATEATEQEETEPTEEQEAWAILILE